MTCPPSCSPHTDLGLGVLFDGLGVSWLWYSLSDLPSQVHDLADHLGDGVRSSLESLGSLFSGSGLRPFGTSPSP